MDGKLVIGGHFYAVGDQEETVAVRGAQGTSTRREILSSIPSGSARGGRV